MKKFFAALMLLGMLSVTAIPTVTYAMTDEDYYGHQGDPYWEQRRQEEAQEEYYRQQQYEQWRQQEEYYYQQER